MISISSLKVSCPGFTAGLIPAGVTADEVAKKPEQNVDLIQKITGSWGRYHLFLCAILFFCKILVAYHQMAILFLAPKTSYSCGNTTLETCPCPDPVYDTSVFTHTIIMEWDLICERKWLASLTQTLFQFGTLVGSIVFGMASDRFGRRLPLLAAVVMQVSAGIICAFMPGYWLFTFFRFFIGMSVGGTMVTSFVIVMEFVGTQYRELISALYQVPFNIGHILLPLNAYFFRDYVNFQLAVSIPAAIMLMYFCLVPDTPRWLIAVKKTDQAIHTLEKVAKFNKRPTNNIRQDVEVYQASLEKQQLKKGNILDLFRTPNIRKNILAMSFNWFACSYCFYGVSQYVGQLSGDVFMNVAASASVTMLGTFVSIPLMKVFGRKTLVVAFQFLCSICLVILAITPEGNLSVACASIGVVASFIVFVLVYLYCSEMFPTVVRNAAIGISSMLARVGSMIAPFVIDLRATALWLPPLVFAIPPLLAGIFALFLPETKGCELMVTIEEGENFGKKKRRKVADNSR